MAETLSPLKLEVAPLTGQEREAAIIEAQALLSGEPFNPIYFSRVIGNVAKLVGGTTDTNGSHITTPPIMDRQNDRALIIWHYPKNTNSLRVEPSWFVLPPEDQIASRGQEPFTREYTSILYRYDGTKLIAGEGLVYEPLEEASVLELHSTLWFPINTVDKLNYLGGSHWTDQDSGVRNGWTSHEKTYIPGPEGQRFLAKRVFNAWQKADLISSGQQQLPM